MFPGSKDTERKTMQKGGAFKIFVHFPLLPLLPSLQVTKLLNYKKNR